MISGRISTHVKTSSVLSEHTLDGNIPHTRVSPSPMSNYFGEVALENSYASAEGAYLGIAPEATTVLYAPGDLLGLACAYASLVPIFLCVALLTVFLCRRTAEDLWVGGGQIVCEIVNGLVKLITKEPRPASPVTNMPVDSYGMPSAHSQYMGFFATVIIIQSLCAGRISGAHRALRAAAVLALSTFSAFSRYYLYYHTIPQVVIGYLIGVVFGIAWMALLAVVRKSGLLSWGLSLWPCRLLLVKDVKYSVAQEYAEFKKLE